MFTLTEANNSKGFILAFLYTIAKFSTAILSIFRNAALLFFEGFSASKVQIACVTW
ncbi:hypothetical protein [Polaribacter sp. SA4-10]|uniref:hypothetical protein n=1 Tax=Polaribacter sp. SA4-10 TaxID=754397 RepID=UPI0018E03615|nr:hypothetical protein [Polaribacter sp. SA4-10]